ncbi:hypothetical protein V6N13_089786 [Hibiscus sabdariffa]|uniref:Uncharacterized protein n=1 Tax=Hibiscus sabdariffa TaxID=183260 RepID=A0ABR2QIS6_9ROSI
MTSASELFYTRRSRVGRPDPDSGIGSSVERNYHRRNHLSHHNNRHDLDGGDPLRRSSHVRHFSSRASALSERSSVRFDEGIGELVSSNGLNADSVSSSRRQSLRSNERLARPRFDEGTSELLSSNGLYVDGVSNVSSRSLSSDERLPGAVLLARARLLERLRGVSVSANRRSRTPPDAYRQEHVSDDDSRTVNESQQGSHGPSAVGSFRQPRGGRRNKALKGLQHMSGKLRRRRCARTAAVWAQVSFRLLRSLGPDVWGLSLL